MPGWGNGEIGIIIRNHTRLVIVLIAMALLALSAVGAGVLWCVRPTHLSIAVGPRDSAEARFSYHLAMQMEHAHASVRLSVLPNIDGRQAAAALAHGKADLAIIRSDAPVPEHSRAVAILEKSLLLLIVRPDSEIHSIADLKGKRVAVRGMGSGNDILIRRLLGQYEVSDVNPQAVTSDVPIDQLLYAGQGFDVVVAIEPLSYIANTTAFEDLAHRMGSFSVFPINDSNALEMKISGLYAETLNAGLLSGSPRIPDQDMNTLAVQTMLVAYDDLPEPVIVDVMRVLFENRNDLAVNHNFATHITAPDLDIDAQIPPHGGAIQYTESDVESFMDRYSDLIYLSLSAGSVFVSVGFALFSSLIRVKPCKASEHTHAVVKLVDDMRAAETLSDLDLIEIQLENILKQVLQGLRDGTISSDGLDAFRLGYEHAHTALVERRHVLLPSMNHVH